jgi:hypothetical protein
MKKYNIFDFFSKPKELIQTSTPDDYCPNCWGEQEYDHKIRQLHQDKQIDVNNHEANHAFIKDFVVTYIDGIHLQKGDKGYECLACKREFKF